MTIKPHDYQEQGIEQIFEEFKTHRKVLYQLSTGGGKTFVFSFLTKEFVKRVGKKIVILCHRDELVGQTIESMNKIGVTCEALTAKTRKLKHNCDCYVAMIETADNRLKKNPYLFKNVGLVVADECHILIFDKVFHYFEDSKILGCTASPIINKRVTFWKCRFCKTNLNEPVDCCDHEPIEWTKPFSMSRLYETIVVGPPIMELIKRGTLVQEISIAKTYVDESVLKVDGKGEFTSESIDEAYGGDNAAFNVILHYEEYCKGKKTMIFNGTSKQNLLIWKKFTDAGYDNVRMYDSVNKTQSGNRKDLLDWFRSTPDAILLNVGVFTTGFDDKTVQAIIINRPTMSLSLFIQIAGRGARSTDEIFKDNFILIDGGGNIDRFGEFSDPTRDWVKIFWEGIGIEKAKKSDSLDVQICDDCGFMHSKYDQCCPNCGYVEVPEEKPKREEQFSEEILTPIKKIPPPNGETIYRYTIANKENINFSFKVLISYIIDMFKLYRVTLETYLSTLKNGKLERRIRIMINKCYFYLLAKDDIKADNNRTIQYIVNKVLENLKKLYNQ